jgi:hypothetical protein
MQRLQGVKQAALLQHRDAGMLFEQHHRPRRTTARHAYDEYGFVCSFTLDHFRCCRKVLWLLITLVHDFLLSFSCAWFRHAEIIRIRAGVRLLPAHSIEFDRVACAHLATFAYPIYSSY